ncbi:MAG: ROK family protein [Candidatus Omnitrophica bacterium]|nr:ROK family protein [Candidatus Omnitrophota bacterium]
MSAKFIVSIDLGGTNLRIALINLQYRIVRKQVMSTRNFSTKDKLTLAICAAIKNIIEAHNLRNKDILGVGLGLPGPIDVKRGLVHFLPNIPGWRKVYLKNKLEKMTGLSVFLDNDAKLMSLAEHRLGAARGFRNALCLTLGTGVGAGIIIEGELYRGRDNASAEIGHLPINEDGPKCNCGGTACLETYIGNNSIINKARKAFGPDVSLEELSRLAKHGSAKACAIWLNVAKHLGTALVGAVNLLNPECIVIGGGIAGAGKILFSRVREIISRQAMSVQAKGIKVLKAKLGNDAGLVGAAIMVKEGIS